MLIKKKSGKIIYLFNKYWSSVQQRNLNYVIINKNNVRVHQGSCLLDTFHAGVESKIENVNLKKNICKFFKIIWNSMK